MLLTGTPLQNNVEELFSLLNFLEPGQFRSSSQFMDEFGDLKSESQVEKLQQVSWLVVISVILEFSFFDISLCRYAWGEALKTSICDPNM